MKPPLHLRNIIAMSARPVSVFYLLPPLMLILVAGTVAQRFMGLYEAQNRFFSSFILWLGPVPLPGGYSLIAVLSLCLVVKFLFFSTWSRRKAGINLAHLGVITLLLGGLVTALHAREGALVIFEGEAANTVTDYHRRELVLIKNDVIHTVIPAQMIRSGKTLFFDDVPFSVATYMACKNCAILRRDDAPEENESGFLGMARFMALEPAAPEKKNEENLYGATIGIKGAGAEFDGTYVIFDVMPEPIEISYGEDRYSLIYQKQHRTLPFSIRLEDFKKKVHPGTSMARAYSSAVIVEDHGSFWPALIEMNKPLRYRGYTFFQSSFAETPGGTATVLAVVKNDGWLFPYLGTAIITVGLLLHLAVAGFQKRGAAA